MSILSSLEFSDSTIRLKRAEIGRRLIELSPRISRTGLAALTTVDLELLFQLYDEIFFERRLSNSFQGNLRFSLSSRMTKSAGKTIYPKYPAKIEPSQLTAEIRIRTDFFLHYNDLTGLKMVSGIITHNALEALQLVFEHELCHLIEFISFNSSNCKKRRFKTLARRLFGHTESYHKLPTPAQIAWQKYGFKPGDPAGFIYEGQLLQGIIYRIQKRAIIIVKDPQGIYRDRQGTRYTKYYIPLKQLIRRN